MVKCIDNITVCSILSVQKSVVMAGHFPSATAVFKYLMGKNRHWSGNCTKPSSLLILSAPLFVPGFRAITCRFFPGRTGFFGTPYFPCHYIYRFLFYTCMISELHQQYLHFSILSTSFSPRFLNYYFLSLKILSWL